ncbi:MAG: response regulator [Magnetococcales bacterium]|nr:response regulator [Magnetococcales bacterium]MBF0113719.1 response regulator [Magnetococcales bacterium]
MKHYANRPFVMQWILLGAMTLLSGALLGVDLFQDYTSQSRLERDRLQAQLRVIHENTNALLRTAHTILQRLQADLALHPLQATQAASQIKQWEAYAVIPGIRSLLVVDEQGIVRYSNRTELLQLDVKHRAFYDTPRRQPEQNRLYLSPPFRSRIDNQILVMNLSRALLAPDGSFAGVVAITLDADYFRTVMQSVLYAADMQVALLHGDGQLFLQVPEREVQWHKGEVVFFGEQAEPGQLWPQWQHYGFSGKPSGQNRRIGMALSIQPTELHLDQPILVVVSRLIEVVHGDWYWDAQIFAGLFLLSVLLIACVLYYSQQKIHLAYAQAGASEAALRKSDAQQQEILNHAPAVIFMKDLQGRYLMINRRCEQWLGRSNQEVNGKQDGDLFPAEVAALLRDSDQEVLRRGVVMVEEKVPMCEGERIVLANKFLLRESDGTPYAICGIVTDISARKQAEEQLRLAKEAAMQASRSKSLFLAAMSHEIRTPMHAIIGMGDALQETVLDAEQRRCLHIMVNAGNMLMGLINDILDLSKIEAGQLEVECLPLDLRQLVYEVEEMMRGGIRDRGLRLQVHLNANVPKTVRGDGQRLRQVLFNLIDNARKFTTQGAVHLTVSRLEGVFVRFAVTDSGIGIGEERLQDIFEPFVQGENASGRLGGAGLGLSICRQLVALMGGEIQVVSRIGEGSTFSFVLPMEPVEGAEIVPQVHAQTVINTSSGLHVLAVDDAEDNLRLLEAFLKRSPHRLCTAMNGADGLVQFQNDTFDLVLMDIQMPIMDGYQATRAMREWEVVHARRRTPIVAFTAHAMKEVSEQILAAGCDAVLTKPLRKQGLLDMLDNYC